MHDAVQDGRCEGGGDTPIPTVMESIDCLCREMRDDLVVAMLAQIDARHDLLFAGPVELKTPDGTRQLQPQRTNNILERFFRSLNRSICRRTGRPAAEIDINRLPVDVPLVANLDNPRYLEALLDGAPTLAERMATVDRKLLDDTLADLRSSRSGLNRKLRERMRKRVTPLEIALLMLATAA